jgi:prepilin-type processing-associated H-X9-DG protein
MQDGWVWGIMPYVKEIGVWRCPSDGKGLGPAPDASGWCGRHLSYPGNAFHAGWNGTTAYAMGPFNYAAESGATWLESGGIGMAKMTRPADTILLGEKHGQDVPVGQYPGPFCSSGAPTGDVFTNNMGDFGHAIPDGTRDPSIAYPWGRNGGVSARHHETATFAFIDGHVKAMKPVQTNPDPVNHWELNLWDGTRQ